MIPVIQFNQRGFIMDQKTKVEEFQQIIKQQEYSDQQHKYFRQSQALLLSQIINFRLNLPRQEERKYHLEMIKEVFIYLGQQARKFNINRWQEFIDKDELYQMSLTGHLIKAIQLEEGSASLANLISVTEPYLPFLRKQNGKNFTGMAARTVKGCLSAIVFKRNTASTWSVDESKVDEFITQANKKLAQYFEKLKKNFPLYDSVKNEGNGKKNKKKQKQENKNSEMIDPPYKDDNIKQENNFSPYEYKQMNQEWHLFISENIFRNLGNIKQGEKLDDAFMGNLIAFYNMKQSLERMPECLKFID